MKLVQGYLCNNNVEKHLKYTPQIEVNHCHKSSVQISSTNLKKTSKLINENHGKQNDLDKTNIHDDIEQDYTGGRIAGYTTKCTLGRNTNHR
ncbi:hypothetical protein STEG23_032414 [Scotinomys teguina]